MPTEKSQMGMFEEDMSNAILGHIFETGDENEVKEETQAEETANEVEG